MRSENLERARTWTRRMEYMAFPWPLFVVTRRPHLWNCPTGILINSFGPCSRTHTAHAYSLSPVSPIICSHVAFWLLDAFQWITGDQFMKWIIIITIIIIIISSTIHIVIKYSGDTAHLPGWARLLHKTSECQVHMPECATFHLVYKNASYFYEVSRERTELSENLNSIAHVFSRKEIEWST